jgi:hypothetical protein
LIGGQQCSQIEKWGWENHEAALALFFGYYNFCRVHSTIKTTPAVKAGLADRPWTVQELLAKIAAPC